MPVPIWLLEFREEKGRDPKPSELSEGQRRHLNECIRESRDSYPPAVISAFEAIVGLRAAGGTAGPDPDKVFEELHREYVHYLPMLSAHFKWVRENRPEVTERFAEELRLKVRELMSIPSKPGDKNPKSMRSALSVIESMINIALIQGGEN